MAERKERRGLGRGLSALMADADLVKGPASAPRQAEAHVPIEQIEPNPDQPRRSFVSESLEELAASISARGIIQPLIVRRHPEKVTLFQIVAGERRWRAAQIAQLHELPVIVRDLDDTEVLEVAIIENIQRADLNAVDEAVGYRQLMHKFGHTQERMAEALGKSRSHIANSLRLLNLPEDVQQLLAEGKLQAGHARALVATDNASEIARQIVKKGLSVRAVEALVRRPRSHPSQPQNGSTGKDADTCALEADLSSALGMKVVVDHRKDAETGRLIVTYASLSQLERLCRLLSEGRES